MKPLREDESPLIKHDRYYLCTDTEPDHEVPEQEYLDVEAYLGIDPGPDDERLAGFSIYDSTGHFVVGRVNFRHHDHLTGIGHDGRKEHVDHVTFFDKYVHPETEGTDNAQN